MIVRANAPADLGGEREVASALDGSDGAVATGAATTVAAAEIAAIEVELDALEEASERCRKTIGAARTASAAGALLLAIAIWRADATSLVIAIAAILGGLAVAGSTRTTRAGLLDRMIDADARRTALIDGLDLPDSTPPMARQV